MQKNSYHTVSKSLHWIMFVLIALALAMIEVREDIPKGTPLRDSLKIWHMLVGQLVLLFVIVRVVARLSFRAPPAIPGPRWQTASAHAVHGLLYLLMFALPMSGVVFYQAAGKEVEFLGWILPHLVAPDPALKGNIKEIHETMGNVIYFLVGIHVLGALYHHFIVKDDTLKRMLPGKN
ncbi:cytochrome b [Undibacterium parvum]|uniref:Cytochrome b n=2 Tax=Undibacterium TaxID=401469 RepID=A0A6M4A1J0_9BURK|nr:cytochrome b [Undibacterium parvum]AZP13846.1 cytochrome b [Undibacterium parvum]QJQ04828.1 cytochrome b [Undibacterium piscinae]